MSNDIVGFETAIKREIHNFSTWAGTTLIDLADRDVVGRAIHPESGDWVVYDARGQTGLLGVAHDNWSDITPVKIKNAKDRGINLRLKKIPRLVSTIDLMKRYIWINDVFLSWLHVNGGSPFSVWKTPEDMSQAFEAEAAEFADDPHLALYWLMQFGLCLDPRYAQVADAIRARGHDQTLEQARLALAFFDGTGPEHDFDLTPSYNPNGKDYSGLFLRRRANLLYQTYSQSYRGNGAVDPLWLSVSLSRGQDRYAIIRMRWFRNNLEKYDLWDTFADRLNDPANDNIPFIAYARLFQPGRDDTAALADALVAELVQTRPTWSNHHSAFGKVILEDICTHVGDKPALRAAAMTVFDGDLGNDAFATILASMGEAGWGSPETREKLAGFEAIFDGIRSLRMSDQTKTDALLGQADELLARLEQTELSFFVGASTNANARIALLRHVMLNAVPGQEDHIFSLHRHCAFKDYDLKYVFQPKSLALATDPQQPLARAMLRILALPPEGYSSAHLCERAVEAACLALRPIAHLPDVFDAIMTLLEGTPPAHVPDAVFYHLFDDRSKSDHQPTQQLNSDQTQRLVLTCLSCVREAPDAFRYPLGLVQTCLAQHPDLIKDSQTLVFKSLLQIIGLPEGTFKAPHEYRDAVELACHPLAPLMHRPDIWTLLLDMVEDGNRAVFTSGLFAYEMARHDTVAKLTQPQIERLLGICVSQLQAFPGDSRHANRAIEACVSPLALPWVRKTLADESLLDAIKRQPNGFMARYELERLLKDLVEGIEEIDS